MLTEVISRGYGGFLNCGIEKSKRKPSKKDRRKN